MTRLRSHSNFSNKASGLSSLLLGLRGIFRVTSMPQISALSHQIHLSQVSAPFEPDLHLLPSLFSCPPCSSHFPLPDCHLPCSRTPALTAHTCLGTPGGSLRPSPSACCPRMHFRGWGGVGSLGRQLGAGVPAPTPEPQSVSSDGCGQRSLGTDPGSKSLTQPSCAGGGGGTRGSPRARLPAMNQAARQSQLAQTRARR